MKVWNGLNWLEPENLSDKVKFPFQIDFTVYGVQAKPW
jgi:hypothetical protein